MVSCYSAKRDFARWSEQDYAGDTVCVRPRAVVCMSFLFQTGCLSQPESRGRVTKRMEESLELILAP